MDELQMMERLRPDPIPMPDIVARHRRQLAGAIAATVSQASQDAEAGAVSSLTPTLPWSPPATSSTSDLVVQAEITRRERFRAQFRNRSSRRAFAAALVTVALVSGALFLRSAPGGIRVAAGVPETSSIVMNQDAPISVRLVLDQTAVKAGATLPGVVDITNSTGQAVKLDTCSFDPWPIVFLTNAALQYQFPTNLGLCAAGTTLAPGVTKRPVMISTMYPGCTYPGPRYSTLPAMPYCTGTSDPPPQIPLPPGHYQTTIMMPAISYNVDLPAPTEVTIS